jgi:phenylpropionate dioxygenase-like ring-hydroxylating dioxygenase large terminal subunit
MLTQAENELITRTGADTPGGAYLRRFWFPILTSDDLSAGGAPRKVRLLGDDFVAFRAADGRVGLLDEACPHRRASLALARVEACGLRCLFHGWKLDVEGAVVEVPSEPDGARFAPKVRSTGHPVREIAGVIWAFIGTGEPSQFPDYAFGHVPLEQIRITRALVRCNWVQMVEGFLDSSHISHLHASVPADPTYLAMKMADTAPTFDVAVTPYGLNAAALRSIGEGQSYTRVTDFVLPATGFIPAPRPPGAAYEAYPESVLSTVPIDDVTTLQWWIRFTRKPEYVGNLIGGGWVQRYESDALWGQDRDKMAAGHATGLPTLAMEDIAMAESQGPIADRSREYLGSSDSVITRYRRLLIEHIRLLAGGGTPSVLGGTIDYGARRARGVIHPVSMDWRDAGEVLGAAHLL